MAADAVKVAPDIYKVILENDRVRVLESRMRPGDKTAMHGHPPAVGCAITGGKFKFTGPDGQTMEIGLNSGDAVYMDAVEHTTENVGTTEGVILIVELK